MRFQLGDQLAVGLDFETTGLDIMTRTHVPIEVGVSAGGECFSSLIGGWDFEAHSYEFGAGEIHGIHLEQVQAAPSVYRVDLDLAHWAVHQLGVEREALIGIGWNPAPFDYQLLRLWFPMAFQLFSHRAIDLNSIVYALALVHDEDPTVVKEAVKAEAEGRASMGRHRALADATYAELELEILLEHMGAGTVPL